MRFCVLAAGLGALAIIGGCGRGRSTNEKLLIKDDAGIESVRARRVATSVVQLIANPEKYDGAKAHLDGFLTMDRPDRDVGYLHLNEEDAKRMLGTNVEVLFGRCNEKEPPDSLIPVHQAMRSNNKYVGLVGTFMPRPEGSMSVGVVCDITELLEKPEHDQTEGGKSTETAASASGRRIPK